MKFGIIYCHQQDSSEKLLLSDAFSIKLVLWVVRYTFKSKMSEQISVCSKIFDNSISFLAELLSSFLVMGVAVSGFWLLLVAGKLWPMGQICVLPVFLIKFHWHTTTKPKMFTISCI